MSKSFIEEVTKSNMEEQNFLLRYYARVEINIKLEILSRHRKIFYNTKQKYSTHKSIEQLSYISLILAIRTIYTEFKKLSTKKFEDMNLDEIEKLTLLDIQSFKSKKHYKNRKKDKLLQYWGVVKLLREENVSFRDIADYLKKKYRFNIGYSSIYKVWGDVEK